MRPLNILGIVMISSLYLNIKILSLADRGTGHITIKSNVLL